jgi:deazaflavin-dependent oxidoreductase (nitroreductase family)
VRNAVAWISRTSAFRRVAPAVLPPLERVAGVLTGGRFRLPDVLVPSLVLHTTGARSGLPREHVLMYAPDNGTFVVAGSNFGKAAHPAWSDNLLAQPLAEATVRGRRVPVRAELLAGAERDRAYDALERQIPHYRHYERISGRTVRVFRLTPRG